MRKITRLQFEGVEYCLKPLCCPIETLYSLSMHDPNPRDEQHRAIRAKSIADIGPKGNATLVNDLFCAGHQQHRTGRTSRRIRCTASCSPRIAASSALRYTGGTEASLYGKEAFGMSVASTWYTERTNE